MTTRPPADLGMALEAVDTPALLIELDPFEENLRRLQDYLSGTSVNLRPHGKAHKCPIIGHMQIAQGAVGLCCQKVSEAEAMVFGGIADILVTNEIVGAPRPSTRLRGSPSAASKRTTAHRSTSAAMTSAPPPSRAPARSSRRRSRR